MSLESVISTARIYRQLNVPIRSALWRGSFRRFSAGLAAASAACEHNGASHLHHCVVPQPCCLLVSHTANRVSKLRAGCYRRWFVTRSSEREVSEASVRGAACVGQYRPVADDPQPTKAPSKSRSAAVSTEVCYPFCRKHRRY